MKSKTFLSIFVMILLGSAYGQNVGIGTTSPAAKLDITSSNSGILIPRVALTGSNNASPLSNPALSTLVYNTAAAGSGATAVSPGFYYWNGSAWILVIDNSSLAGATTVSNTSSGNNLSTTVSGVTGSTVPIVNSVSNASAANTLSTTVNGVTGATAPIINSNALSLSGTTLTSTVNGLASGGLNLSSLDNNIYNSDGTLTGNRTMTMGGNTLDLTGGNVGIGMTPSYTLDVNGNIRANTTYRTQSSYGQIVQIGDDAWLNDVNMANTMGIIGNENSSYGGLSLGTGGAYLYSNGSGYIGINNTTPGNTLAINGSGGFWNDNKLNFYTDGGATQKGYIGIYSTSGSDFSVASTASGSWLRLGANSSSISFFPDGTLSTGASPMVRINTQNSSSTCVADQNYAVLEVWGTVNSPMASSTNSSGCTNPTQNQSNTGFQFLNHSTQGSSNTSTAVGRAFSLYTWGSIWCNGEVDVTSDERIKNVFDTSSSESDLAAINKLKIVDYEYKDKVGEGQGKIKGFLAQQIETIYPDAVKKQAGIIPDIYKIAESCCYDSATRMLTLTMPVAHGLVKGDRVQLMDTKNGHNDARNLIVYEVKDDKTFVVENWTGQPKEIFVYGKEVPDLRNIDYNKIFSAGISAIQELSKRLSAEQAKNAALEQRLSSLMQHDKDTHADIDKLKASVEALQQIIESNAQKLN